MVPKNNSTAFIVFNTQMFFWFSQPSLSIDYMRVKSSVQCFSQGAMWVHLYAWYSGSFDFKFQEWERSNNFIFAEHHQLETANNFFNSNKNCSLYLLLSIIVSFQRLNKHTSNWKIKFPLYCYHRSTSSKILNEILCNFKITFFFMFLQVNIHAYLRRSLSSSQK